MAAGKMTTYLTSVSSSQSSVTSVLGDPIPTSEISVHYTQMVHIHIYIGKTFIHIQKNLYIFLRVLKVEVPLKAYGVALTPLEFCWYL